MITVDDALALIRARCAALPGEAVPLADAEGRVLAATVHACRALPPFDNSAMDGFAVRWHASLGEGSVLPVAGEQAAGDGACTLADGACHIMTGAMMPVGADTVVPVEQATVLTRDPGGRPLSIRLEARPERGQHVRLAGQDVPDGSAVLHAGTRLGAEALMVLRGVGVAEVTAYRRPRVALACTGRELVATDGASLAPGQITDTNGPYLGWLLQRFGAELVARVTVPDAPDALVDAVRTWEAAGVDLVISTGAVSMGRYDFVPEVLQALGGTIVFHKVAMRPGKPLMFASLPGGALFFGLPGNPVSSAVGARFFVGAALRRLQGLDDERAWSLPLAKAIHKKAGVRVIQKASLRLGVDGCVHAEPTPGQESFRIAPMLQARAWVHLPDAAGALAAGITVPVYPADPLLDTLFSGD